MEFLGIRTKSGAIVQPNSGEEMIRKFDFAYSTPGLTTGVVVYTPTVGDILLDAWIEIDTAFNGTTPFADISQFVAGPSGWFQHNGPTAVDLTVTDDDTALDSTLLCGRASFDRTLADPGGASPLKSVALSQVANLFTDIAAGAFSTVRSFRSVPAKFTSPNPVKLVVSQDGLKGGTATGATQGAGHVYFLTGTPQ